MRSRRPGSGTSMRWCWTLAASALLATIPAGVNAQTPGESFRKGLEKGQELRDQLLGRSRAKSRQDELVAMQSQVMALYRRGELKPALEQCDAYISEVEKTYGRQSREYSAALGIKASILQDTGQYEPAIALYREAVGITRAVSVAEPHYYAQDLLNFADAMRTVSRLNEARRTLDEAIAIVSPISTPAAQTLHAMAMVSLGEVLRQLKRLDEAEEVLTRAVQVSQKPPVENIEVLNAALANRALARIDQGRYGPALSSLDQMMEVLRLNALDRSGLAVLLGGHRSGLLSVLNRHDDAVAQGRTNLDLAKALFPGSEALIAKFEAALGTVLVKAGRLPEARELLTRALGVLVDPRQRLEDEIVPPVEEERFQQLYVAALATLTAREGSQPDDVAVAALAKLTRSGTERALRQMTLRAAAREPALADDVRRLQDIEARYVAARRAISALPMRVSTTDVELLRAQIERLLAERETLKNSIERRFVAYREIAHDVVLQQGQLRQQLGEHEALVWVFASPQPLPLYPDYYVWVLTRSQSRLFEVPLSAKELETEVAALRCGLDPSAWTYEKDVIESRKAAQIARRKRCLELSASEPKYDSHDAARMETLPFDPARAHRLYTAIFAKAAPLLAGKTHINYVGAGPLTELPPHLLVSRPPSGLDLTQLRWLADDYSIAVLPSGTSLFDLRRTTIASRAKRPSIAFANPLLKGDPHGYKQAVERTACAAPGEKRTLQRRASAAGTMPKSSPAGTIDQAQLAFQLALPDTADEACDVARALGADLSDVRLAARATETEVKRLSAASGDERLANYRVLHFATHGLLAGDLDGADEPGLILTPPAQASGQDDGYLAMTEIAGLKLDADWIVLSACNTAGPAGTATGSEALSGLARAFFLAGARALLVSHWVVDSEATAQLVAAAVAATADGRMGRSQALQAAMAKMRQQPGRAHPAFWAPFVVAGEGMPRG